MTILQTHIDPNSAEFKLNAEYNQALAAELRERTALAHEGGRAEVRARHERRGNLFVRDRIERLLDPGTAWLEVGTLAAADVYADDVPAAGVITGIGCVAGQEVMIVANDATVKGGTYYPLTVKNTCERRKSPCKIICRAFIWWIAVARFCRCRPMCSLTATISGGFSSIKPKCRRLAFRRLRW